ncbi:peptidylprolyl isomerase [Candidatus Woesearchaeota archaeon]|nr:peptidylprolyl isomerase [Candidatus Woesearchaeota archaeon]
MKKLLLILAFLLLAGCSSSAVSTSQKVLVETNKGYFTIELYDDTPITTTNFLKLIEEGFYDNLTFHRYEPGFVIQGGDPNGDGTGGSADTIKLEVIGRSHYRGTVGMARSSNPNSASSQFFVNLADNDFLDEGYTVFGKVTEGMDVVDELRAGDKIIHAAKV